MNDLKSCPFCGKSACLSPTGHHGFIVAECEWCGASTTDYEPIDKDKAIAAWNRRAENARLREALKGHQRWLELLEWAQPGHENGDDRFYCINCGQYEENGGHSENCEWAESIREGRAALKEKP